MLLELLSQLLHEPCFNTLRTKEQLGEGWEWDMGSEGGLWDMGSEGRKMVKVGRILEVRCG